MYDILRLYIKTTPIDTPALRIVLVLIFFLFDSVVLICSSFSCNILLYINTKEENQLEMLNMVPDRTRDADMLV